MPVDLMTFMAIAGPAASFGGAFFGMKWRMENINKRLDEHQEKHQSHEQRLAGHDLAIGLLQGGKQ